MGPSGSGKTTLLNLLGGIDTPSSGQIQFAGQRIEGLAKPSWRAGARPMSASSSSSTI